MLRLGLLWSVQFKLGLPFINFKEAFCKDRYSHQRNFQPWGKASVQILSPKISQGSKKFRLARALPQNVTKAQEFILQQMWCDWSIPQLKYEPVQNQIIGIPAIYPLSHSRNILQRQKYLGGKNTFFENGPTSISDFKLLASKINHLVLVTSHRKGKRWFQSTSINQLTKN